MIREPTLPAAGLFEAPTQARPLRLYDRTKLRSWVAAAFAIETLRDGPAALADLRDEVAQGTGFPKPDAVWEKIAASDIAGIARRVLADTHEGEAARDRLPEAIDRKRFDHARRVAIMETVRRMERDGLVAYGWGAPADDAPQGAPPQDQAGPEGAAGPQGIRGGAET